MKKLLYIVTTLIILVALVWVGSGCGGKAAPPTETSPPPTETQTPPAPANTGLLPASAGDSAPAGTSTPYVTPTYISDSEFMEIALSYVSRTYGLPRERLRLNADQIERKEYPVLGVAIKLAKVRDTMSSEGYLVVVDANGQVRDFQELEASEQAAAWARYGKLSPGLHELLETKGPDDLIEVHIWVTGVSQKDINAIARQVASKYPDAHLKGIGPSRDTPMDLYENVIFPEYRKALKEAHLAASRPLVEWLQGLGYQARGYESAPAAYVVVPKRLIAEIAARPDVSEISHLPKPKPAMDSAAPTLSAPSAWQRGIIGWGVKVGIVDVGTVDPENPYLGVQVVNNADKAEHSAWVAGAAASLHPLYLGTAYGVSGALGNRSTNIVSAGYQGTTFELATQATLDAGARIVNLSWGNDNEGQWLW